MEAELQFSQYLQQKNTQSEAELEILIKTGYHNGVAIVPVDTEVSAVPPAPGLKKGLKKKEKISDVTALYVFSCVCYREEMKP